MNSGRLLKIIGKEIRTARKARGLSQEKLSELAGLHPTYISDMENGKVNASIWSYFSVSRALGIPLSELVDIPAGKADAEFENNISAILASVRGLNKRSQAVFFRTAEGLLAGLREGK